MRKLIFKLYPSQEQHILFEGKLKRPKTSCQYRKSPTYPTYQPHNYKLVSLTQNRNKRRDGKVRYYEYPQPTASLPN